MQTVQSSWLSIMERVPPRGARIKVRLANGTERFANIEVSGEGAYRRFLLAGTDVAIPVTHWTSARSLPR
jgi:hypothetical protein